MNWNAIESRISEATGRGFVVEESRPVGGGCINEAYVVGGAGQQYFVKFNAAESIDMFEAEFDGLAEIAATESVRVPRPIAVDTDAGRAWIAMEFIALSAGRAGSQRELGEQLARMHRRTRESFGWHRDNTIGSTPQINTPSESWVDFYRENRLRFQFDLAARNGGRFHGAEELLDGLDEFFTDYDPAPALLHGDLWSGNVAADKDGHPVIFDPAVYYGDREADFGIAAMFGGFSREFYQAYDKAFPLDPGFEHRRPLYILYHKLNHFNLFGGGYAGSAQSSIHRLLNSR